MVTIFELIKVEQTELEKVEDIFGELAVYTRDVKRRNRFSAATTEVPEFRHPSLSHVIPEEDSLDRETDSRSY